jgi:hypothetical protein
MKWNVGNKKGGLSSVSQRNNIAASLQSTSPSTSPIFQPKLIQMGTNKETIIENLDSFFYSNASETSANDKKNDANAYYLPTVGVTNLKLCEPNEVIADQATIFFRILDAF